MARVIEVDKSKGRTDLDKELHKLTKKKAPINLDKYFGKIDFGVDGLEYQLKVRNDWR
ncbi:MAG TPA: hypothetical protein VHB54_08185 [Mucilaginibacter sp.]|nr:hypothetical protein [Mucilaginibacter sp.]